MFPTRILFAATSNGDVETLRSADTDYLYVFDPMTGDTLVHVAVQKRQLEAALEIARRIPDILSHRNAIGRTPLFEAVAYGYMDIARELLDLDPSTMFVRDFYGKSPLSNADFLDVIPDELWAYETPIVGNTLMHESAINDLEDLAERAVKKAPRMIRAMMADGMMPIHVAAFFGRVNIARVFLREFPECIRYKTDLGKTPLLCATELSPWKGNDIVYMLFDADPSMIEVQDNNGRTPVFEIARLGTADVMRHVLKAHPNAVLVPENKSGLTPLHVSLYGRFNVWAGVAKEIISACPSSLFVKDRYGLTPLQHAYVTLDKREDDCADFLSHVLMYTKLPTLMWDHIPKQCKHISRALGAALKRSPEEASRVVQHMTFDDRARLCAALFAVGREMASRGVYSEDILYRIVGLAFT